MEALSAIEHGIVVGGDVVRTDEPYELCSPYDGTIVGSIHRATPRWIETALVLAERSFHETRALPSWRRAEILNSIANGLERRREEFATTIALEAGKPIKAARIEVDRAAFTLQIAAEETKRMYGEIVPLDWLPQHDGRIGHVRRVALGPILGITPFNFPLNLVVHKLAPALAAGNPIILRPASQTPISSLKLAELVLEAGWPAGAVAVLPTTTADAARLVEDDRIKLLTFTGSPTVGWRLKAQARMKRVTLELGGNAAVIVHSDADAEYAADRITWGGTTNAGQTCISVQRVLTHRDLHGFAESLVSRFKRLVYGDPCDDATDVGPVIDSDNADRIELWLADAVKAGARVLCGGGRHGNVIEPTLIGDVDPSMQLSCDEVFGPVVGLQSYTDPLAAIAAAGASDFGLQAGIFTNDIRLIDAAFDRIDVGGLMVNDVSTFRIDHMPYGGVKQSGLGREGVKYAIEEMTEMKLLTLNPRPLPE